MLLFVYGSLRRDATGTHHPLLASARFAGAASVSGRLYRVSWHPGLIPDDSAGPVKGELFELMGSREALDHYEGPDFELVAATASTAAGSVAAHVYAWRGNPAAATLVESGDWGPPGEHAARGW